MFRYVLSVLGKGLLYALSFWAVYAFVYTPLYYLMHRNDDSASAEAQTASTEAQTNRQMKDWDDQFQRSAEMLRQSERIQKRYDAILTQQEQQTRRMDAVISAWERQSGVKK
jgi:hypothetical protein